MERGQGPTSRSGARAREETSTICLSVGNGRGASLSEEGGCELSGNRFCGRLGAVLSTNRGGWRSRVERARPHRPVEPGSGRGGPHALSGKREKTCFVCETGPRESEQARTKYNNNTSATVPSHDGLGDGGRPDTRHEEHHVGDANARRSQITVSFF
jgi:hypothetical protein